MKAEELRHQKTDELHNQLADLRRQLFDLRSQAVTEKLEDPTRVRKARKDVARILTVLHERGEQDIEQRQTQLTAKTVKR